MPELTNDELYRRNAEQYSESSKKFNDDREFSRKQHDDWMLMREDERKFHAQVLARLDVLVSAAKVLVLAADRDG